jgi:hypothetical protein
LGKLIWKKKKLEISHCLQGNLGSHPYPVVWTYLHEPRVIVLAKASSNLRDSESILNLTHKYPGHFLVLFWWCGNNTTCVDFVHFVVKIFPW